MLVDQSARQQALNPRESFIMEAPAGSGKTEVLVRRILSLLLTVEHPRSLLAITFTRKAAAEMYERVHQALHSDEHHDPDKIKLIEAVRQRIEEKNWSEEDLAALSIMTIDALCARILNIDAESVNTNCEVIPDYAVLGDALMLELLEHLAAQDEHAAALTTVFLYFGNNIEKVKNLLLGILAKRSEWLSVFVPRQESSLKEELTTTVIYLYELLWQKWQALAPKAWVCDVNAWLGISSPQELKKIAALLLTKQGDLRKRFDARLGLAQELKLGYQELVSGLAVHEDLELWLNVLQEIQALPDLNFEVGALADALMQILPLIAAHWQILLRTHRYRDFQEEALQALLSLSNNDPVSNALLRFERDLSHILVDEFQDTSGLQFRMLELMTQTWQSGDGRTLFLVGDPMQSIYRFRDAKVELFLEAKAKGLGNIILTPLRLLANFRTDRKIIEFINTALERAFPKHSDILTGAVTFTPSHAERSYPDAIGIEQICFENPEDEAGALTQKIKALLPQDPGAKIGILARSRTHLKLIMQHLVSENIAITAENWGSLFEAQIILDVVSLTLAMTHLGDRMAWMAVLRSPLLSLNLDELLWLANNSRERTLWQAFEDIGVMAGLSVDTQSRLQNFIAILKPLIFAPDIFLLTKVKRAFLALTAEYQFAVLEQNSLEQYWQFLAAQPLILSRQKFLEDLARLKLNYTMPDARITLLTIHQAKGLEFDYVFLPHLNQGVRRDDPPLLRWDEVHYQGQFKLLLGLHKNAEGDEDSIYQYLAWRSKLENAHEQVRLLYVALTRAKKGLCLSYFDESGEDEFKVKAGSFLRLLQI
jgi:ATP-dependent exoDNAse (exonuclease V) beta subunit